MIGLFIHFLKIGISVSWLVLMVLILRFLLKKAPKWIVCLLWAVVALRLVMPVSIESRFSLMPEMDVLPQEIATVPAIQKESPDAVFVPDTHAAQSDTKSLVFTGALIWVVGVSGMLLYSCIAFLRLRLRVRASMPYCHRVYQCDDIDSPFILGTLRPRIYIPTSIEDTWLTYVLSHERAHIQRRDHWWKPLGYLLLSVYWFNPLLWVAYILLCRDIELACDEKVIPQMDTTEKKGYSEALVACSVHRRMVTACPVAFGEVGVKTRIKGIVNYKKPGFWIILLSVLACTATAVCFLTDPRPCEHMEHGVITAYPSCTEKGIETFTCDICQHSYETSLAKIPHSYDSGIITREPTCIRKGILEYTCTGCGDKKTESLPKTAHSPGAMKVTKDSNCTHQGRKASYCTLCHKMCAMETIPTNNVHALTKTVTREPTCTEDGEYTLTCTRCSYTETHIIEKTGHDLFVSHREAATCRTGAHNTYKCKECSFTMLVTVSEPSSECTWFDNRCFYCYRERSTGNSSDLTNITGGNKTSSNSRVPGPIVWDIANPHYDPSKPVGPQRIIP